MIRTYFNLARKAIRKNRGRSFLTCLGIAIGIASITLILSLTGGISRLIHEQFTQVEDRLIIVEPKNETDLVTNVVDELTLGNSFKSSNLTLDDVDAIREIDEVENVAPILIATDTVKSEKNEIQSVKILGTDKDFIKIQSLNLRYGAFLTDDNTKNVIIGHSLSLLLFNTTNPIGKTMTIMGERFVVIGVLSETDNSVNFDNIDFDNAIIMSADNLKALNEGVQVQQIDIIVEEQANIEVVAKNIETTMTENKGGETNFAVMHGDAINHPASNLLSVISAVLTLMAGVSLVVGGIGVMNIMLVSVAERTHEIGVRKAVGASAQNIIMQFIFEALILTVLGGILGIILGYVLAFLISIVLPFEPFISWLVILAAFLLSLLVGIIFGIYPALKAASKSPIESLKHYR